MNRRILIIVLSALVLSVCVSYLVYRAVGAKAASGKPVQTVQVVVASRDLAVGTLVRDTDLTTAAWLGPVPGGSILKRDILLNRGVVSPIYKDEPVTENRLSAKGSGGGLAATIPPGMRACAVRVNEVVGVAGFVVPGMRVDVLITGLPPGGNALDGAKVRTLLQNIQVLSAGMDFKQDQEGKPQQAQVVNLLVTPSDAEILSLASNETRIQLILRNPMDTGISKPPGTIMSDLFGQSRTPDRPPVEEPRATAPMRRAAPTAAPPMVQAPYSIEISNGSVHSRATFSRPAGDQ